ncbi:lamin tail domain-containing protein [Sorangium sp. So ce861]|uniref:lamin tail domain-containing protein n=1 Tax=Sorangium sp. So ce861 TaxID=3133323 RepID=UPI003F5D9323
MQGVRPDIVLLQELNYGDNGADALRTFVNDTFDSTFSYYREAGAQIPNGIVSRYPILEAGEWEDNEAPNRDFAWARIDIPGPIDLWAVSVHFLTSNSSDRQAEARQLVERIRESLPEGDYLVIGGDFNTDTRTESCISTLSEVVVTSGPYPADRNGDADTNAGRSKPYDWVLVDTDLDAHETAVVIGESSFANGLVADTRVYTPIAELSPALATDSGADQMQHMGVVRDFLIPVDTTSPVDPTPGTSAVFLNEILANEPASVTASEFVEIVNLGASAADLGGWTLSDAASVRHTFAAGTTLAPDAAIVVYGGATAVPPGASWAVAASTGRLELTNAGDTVTLKDGSGATVDAMTYDATFPSTDGVSMNRDPDATPGEPFALHTALAASDSSPGTRVDGSPF